MKQSRDSTSRHRALDAIECMKNCEAIVSHCKEIMDSIEDNAFKENAEVGNELQKKYDMLFQLKENATQIRRNLMKKMYEEFENGDHDMWCIFKHCMAAKQFAEEANDACGEFDKECNILYKMMSLALSRFVGAEQQVCARCLLDNFLANNDNEND